jgi:hypothetical protein
VSKIKQYDGWQLMGDSSYRQNFDLQARRTKSITTARKSMLKLVGNIAKFGREML